MRKTYGYIRVSSSDQNENRQLLAMLEARVPESRIFIDKQSLPLNLKIFCDVAAGCVVYQGERQP